MARQQESTAAEDISSVVQRRAPGTELLFDNGNGSKQTAGLQFIPQGDTHILLVPQPSLSDPNDPLRWSPAKKWGTFLNGVAYAFMGSVTGPIMAAMMLPLAESFGETLQRLTYANGATLICQGVGNIFWMPLALKFGRRPVYMLSNILMGIACVWLGLASNASYTPFLVGRAFLGLFEAPIESIVPSTITDIFFLHNRGEKVSFYGLSVLGGNELGPLFSALIIQRYGKDWAFYIVAMFIGLSCVSMFFFMPETKYTRPRPQPFLAGNEADNDEKAKVERIERFGDNVNSDACGESVESAPQGVPKRGFVRSLALWEKPDPNVSLRNAFLRPFVLVTYPTVLWACLVYGVSLGWNVILGATVAQLFAPQYGFDSQAQGLVFLSPFVGSLVGSWLCGSLSDSIANYFTKKNEGVREPEMRLPVCIIATFLTFFGALMSGLTYHYNTHWAGPVVGYGVLSAGAQMGVSLSMSYALDCHQELSVELMVTIASLKSLLAWVWTWVINDWIVLNGTLTVFMVIASINVVIHLTTMILYFRGKSIRIWIAEKDMLTRCGLK
ncbi:major facilitator superfamily domain-containing protein [Dactylonectria macrodidyma]|uniref:Major facilitator superfamily domain-containing protein n=1 Tax=Dactylonectria macrodidyma TaxID=307937 RepID=A0A9P9FN83_9HYPO|nr:major facilitator superfamily domain-containing protein [Dactylonectria macrodidyma]